MNTSRQRERLIALVVLTAALFAPPLLLVAERTFGGLHFYLFLAWGSAIALMAWLMEGGRRK